jgi:hypothetical protein
LYFVRFYLFVICVFNFSFNLWFLSRWHDAGTYDVNTKTGGANGSIRNEEEYSHGSNNGLKKAIDWCGKIFDLMRIARVAPTRDPYMY